MSGALQPATFQQQSNDLPRPYLGQSWAPTAGRKALPAPRLHLLHPTVTRDLGPEVQPGFAASQPEQPHSRSGKDNRKNSNLSRKVSKNLFHGLTLSHGSCPKAQADLAPANPFPLSSPFRGDVYLHQDCVCFRRADISAGTDKARKGVPGGQGHVHPLPTAVTARV